MAGEQILVVEDQRAVAGALQMRLRGLGYAVLAIAKDGPEAIEKAAELHPDLILMDIKLGDGMDGIEAAEQIRTTLDIPVVYVSAYVDQKLLERARQTRPAGFINKPFTTKDLLTTIDLALFQRSQRNGAVPANDPSIVEAEEQTHNAVATTDMNGRINFVSDAARHLLGWRRRQIIGRPLWEAIRDIYKLGEDNAAAIVDRVLKEGSEELLEREGDGAGMERADRLTALRDAHGETFGAALKFSEPVAAIAANDAGRALATAVEALPLGIAIVNESMQILHMNGYAREIFNHNRGLECANNRLSARDRQIDEKLRQLVAGAVAKSAAGESGGSDAMFVKAPMTRDQVEVIATPVVPAPRNGEEACAVVYLFDASVERRVSHEVLTRLYGLTQTEARLVQLLVGGDTLDAAAQTLDIAVNTARTHLKHVFHKTGINRQAELVHRIETGPAGLLVNFDAPA